MTLEQGDVVFCTVDRIIGTTVFVNINGEGEGKIILSEIAPGRIRNLRDYVIPKKIIVCKVLRISGNDVDLSLRRVTPKEKKEVLEQYKLEKSYQSILKSVLGDKTEETIKKICAEYRIDEFFDKVRKNPKELEKFIEKRESEKITEILNCQKVKKASLKKEIQFHTTKPNGLEIIKQLLSNKNQIEIKYLAAGDYSIKVESTDLKKADNKIREIISEIEKEAKSLGIEVKTI
jgi:translation initiation factor 2 alpha subunit (eIF-2alpha)